MKKCPFCAEDIQDDAIKFRYCGEFIGKQEEETSKKLKTFFIYQHPVFIGNKPLFSIESEDKDRALDIALQKLNDSRIQRKHLHVVEAGKKGTGTGEGKYSCPKCKSRSTECQKDIGCLFWILGILTLGLLLIILWPFLPYDCHCSACGYTWKS